MIDSLIPHLSEKSYALVKDLNVYVFKVDPKLNQNQIKNLLKKEYKVDIIDVRTLVSRGKKARSIRLQTPMRKKNSR